MTSPYFLNSKSGSSIPASISLALREMLVCISSPVHSRLNDSPTFFLSIETGINTKGALLTCLGLDLSFHSKKPTAKYKIL